jgi:drug/metabolite transporter (DMT)-like permease
MTGSADKPIALIFLIINAMEIVFTISTAIGRECTRNRGLSIAEVSLIRNSLNFIMSIPPFLLSGMGPFEGMSRDLWLPIIVRTIAGNLGFFTFTSTFKYLPMGIGNIIVLSNPFIVVFLAACLFKDAINIVDILGIVVSFCGILIMAYTKPPALVAPTVLDDRSHYLKGIAFAMTSMVFVATLVTMGRAVKSINYAVVQINYAFWGVVMSLIFLAFETRPEGSTLFVYEQTSTYVLLLVMGLANTMGMFGLVYTSQFAKPTTVSLLRYVGVLYYFLSDVLVFRQEFSVGQLVGAGFMIIANLAYVSNKIKQEQREAIQAESTKGMNLIELPRLSASSAQSANSAHSAANI